MSGLKEVPAWEKKGRVLTHTTELHFPALIGSLCSQMFSWLQPGQKNKQKKQGKYKNSEQKCRHAGLGEEREAGGGGPAETRGGKVEE